jgi:nucleoside-diphosphate-sugar epimerase
MKTALIGYTGFVGSNLDRDCCPTHRYRSTDINSIRGEKFDHVICAGVQAKKWWANLNPLEDMAGIQHLLDALSEVHAERFTLISSIDVYPEPRKVEENTIIDKTGHHAYGLHRLLTEERIRQQFSNVVILRLPGLFGPGLKKNVIYDMMHDNELNKVHPDGMFQYYDLRQLSGDIEKAWNADIRLLNVSTEPISTSEIRNQFFPEKVLGGVGVAPAGYDMQSIHQSEWGGSRGYLYSRAQVLDQMRNWLASL